MFSPFVFLLFIFAATISVVHGAYVVTAFPIPTTASMMGLSAVSSSGQYVIAAGTTVDSGTVIYSSDYGVTWATSNAPVDNYKGLAISKNTGTYAVACHRTKLYYSSNAGQTWTANAFTPTSTNNPFQGLAMSYDGKYVLTNVLNQGIHYSSDYGVTLTKATVSTTGFWGCVNFAMDSTGKYAVCVCNFLLNGALGPLYSSDYGITWTGSTTGGVLSTVAMTGNAALTVAGASGSQTIGLYLSSDKGVSWTASTAAAGSVLYSGILVFSATGPIYAAVKTGGLSVSRDLGATWSTAVSSSSVSCMTGLSAPDDQSFLVIPHCAASKVQKVVEVTSAPTKQPTFAPSAPTVQPTFATSAPTTQPTFATSAPTIQPTFATSAPTIQPTFATSAPTIQPTYATSTPTLTPTSNAPSLAPSVNPTNGPTLAPSNAPSLAPSVNPTNGPTLAPSNAPSLAPSVNPTNGSTLAPSNAPSLAPSVNPTNGPTLAPSNAPSLAPSVNPTPTPTVNPSVRPTVSPTFVFLGKSGTLSTASTRSDSQKTALGVGIVTAGALSAFVTYSLVNLPVNHTTLMLTYILTV
jgi:photosystem II stability/assembly factor-like uncharacterized protein